MIAAVITDYERAVLDALRHDKRLRAAIEGVSGLPETQEAAAHTQEVYNNKWRKEHGWGHISKEEAVRELAQHEAWQEQFRLYYKSRGYKPPYEYGKGRVQVLMQIQEDGDREPEEQAAGAEGKVVPLRARK